jgi:type II secretory pathway component PulC
MPEAGPAGGPEVVASVKAAARPSWQQALEQIKNKLFVPKPGVSVTRQKTMVTLIPILAIALVFVLIRVFSVPSSKTSQARGFEPVKAAAVSESKIDWKVPELYPAGLRDPMQFGSVVATEVKADKLIVKGIVYSEDEPAKSQAVIGSQGYIVREGEEILGATVVKINKDSVEFEREGRRWSQKVER